MTTCIFNLQAKHIIGGETTYRCLGNGLYEFTINMYRDCAGGGAQYDDPAAISIYREDPSGYTLVSNNAISIFGGVINIDPDDNPCAIVPPGICVQKAQYIFTTTLPNVNASYHISYQRCCRNETINNIYTPGERGATFTIELTPEAQDACNNSPVFNDFPPIVICKDQAINFDHSATDPDGTDQIVYAFCAPFNGGGLAGLPGNPGNANGFNGIMPNPAAPPPYNFVNYVSPTYTVQEPMGGTPLISIDPNTGLITGTPTVEGQFVVGVCISEYRNGVLLSQVKRDFQFNVVSCENTVTANLSANGGLENDTLVFNSCGDFNVDFINLSTQEQYIQTYDWNFNIDQTVEEYTTKDVNLTFPHLGTFYGNMILNKGLSCSDTAIYQVNIFPEINADFSFEYDTCIAGPVDFNDLSTTGSAGITDWNWNFGDGNLTTNQNPSHLFENPGDKNITLTVTDVNNCKDDLMKPINWFPAPPYLVIEPSTFIGCQPANILFNNLSSPIDETYDINWTFGEGGTSTDISPTYLYEDVGIYDITVDLVSPIGCKASASFDNWITVNPSPTADFNTTPNAPNNFEPLVDFNNTSLDSYRWHWNIADLKYSIDENTSFEFPDTGLYAVQLIAEHQLGCLDTIVKIVDVEPKVTYYVSNVFTPNEDNTNELFYGIGYFRGITQFNMKIFNRWGEKVFESNDIEEGWNGRKNNEGDIMNNGLFTYIINFTAPRGKKEQLKGYVTLIR